MFQHGFEAKVVCVVTDYFAVFLPYNGVNRTQAFGDRTQCIAIWDNRTFVWNCNIVSFECFVLKKLVKFLRLTAEKLIAVLAEMSVNLRLEAMTDSLYFPLPAEAKDITLNGSAVSTSKSGSTTLVNISRITEGYMGDATMRFEYTIPEAVQVNTESVLEMLKKGSKKKIIKRG